jgi:hypothetical protein
MVGYGDLSSITRIEYIVVATKPAKIILNANILEIDAFDSNKLKIYDRVKTPSTKSVVVKG